jgi:hypothetical protein
MTLPSLELKFKSERKNSLTSTNTNTNTINNNIIIPDSRVGIAGRTTSVSPIAQPIARTIEQTMNQTVDQPLNQSLSLSRIDTPSNIKLFKDAFMDILIGYFKNNIILLNNLIELSEKIITKVNDLQLLISLLLVDFVGTHPNGEVDRSNILIDVEEITSENSPQTARGPLARCCGKICNKLPRYRKINDIIINNKQSFKVSYNQYYIQMSLEFNISLEYILL